MGGKLKYRNQHGWKFHGNIMDYMDSSSYRELLRITKEILKCLERDDNEELETLLAERRRAFDNITRDSNCLPHDATLWIKKIRKCEDRCTTVARKEKKRIQAKLEAIGNRIRIENAYGGVRSAKSNT